MELKNTNLHKAKQAKNDEFYTQLTDIAKELMHYKAHFKDKIVLCNCDDPTWSAFWKYFHLNFAELGLKKLILWKKYTPEEYPKYDNYNAIDVYKVSKIPCDYAGVMGVPITFMDKYNPEQFEIIWQASENTRACCSHAILHDELHYIQHSENRGDCGIVNEKRVYSRILIRKKVSV